MEGDIKGPITWSFVFFVKFMSADVNGFEVYNHVSYGQRFHHNAGLFKAKRRADQLIEKFR